MYYFSYLPKCFQNCNTGKCLNDDLCDCNQTNFKGLYCNEYIQLERNSIVDKIIIAIALVIKFIIIVTTGMTIYYRKQPIIKGGNNENLNYTNFHFYFFNIILYI